MFRVDIGPWMKRESIMVPMAWCAKNCAGEWQVLWENNTVMLAFHSETDYILFRIARL